MFQLQLMGGGKYNITKEEAQSLVGKSGLIPINSLGGMINISSISSILPLEVAQSDPNKRKTKDGEWCIKKFGQWYLEKSPDIKIDLKYFPELEDIKEKNEEPSNLAKRLSKDNNFLGSPTKNIK